MNESPNSVRLGLPKGRMYDGVVKLLSDAGIGLRVGPRAYRPNFGLSGFEVKILKPQTIVEMLALGRRDLGFAGADWVAEKQVDLVELLDTGLDPVRIVAAAPRELLDGGRLPRRADGQPWVVASEYERLTSAWFNSADVRGVFLRSYGATEVFPPDDADAIVDNTATGSTLEANGLQILDTLMTSSTRLYAHAAALDVPEKRERIEHLVLLLRSVLDARTRVMLEINVGSEDLARLVEVLPCMREPTVSPLHGGAGYAVKAAVPRAQLPELIALLKKRGGTDICVTTPAQIVP